MKEIDNEIWAAIASVNNGNPTAEEEKLIQQWLESDSSHQKILDLLANNSFHLRNEDAEPLRETVFESIRVKIAESKSRKTIRIWQYAAAASLALLLSVSAYLAFRTSPSAESYIETRCPEGSRTTVTLDDGTIVELNSGSSLSYPARFTGKERIVALSGEAFFNVTTSKKKPFVVKSGSLNIRVLGTKFNVKAYKNDQRIITTLLEGKVSVENTAKGKEAIVLIPDQQAVFDKNTGNIGIFKVNAELFTVWKEGSFYFDSESLLEISKKLEREFNIHIRITTPELENVLFSGVFDKGESITQILDMLRKYRNFNYRIKNSNVELYIENR